MKKTKLFLLHFAGGNCYSYQFIIPLFKEYFSIIPIELPGRGERINENLTRDFNSAVEDIYYQILNELDDSKFMLFGHSMGACLALKVTSMLEQINKFPSYLFVSGNEGPTLGNNKKRYLFSDKDLIEEMKKLGGMPPEILKSKEFLDFYLPIMRADFEVAEKNSYFKVVINTPIFAMMGSKEEDVDNISNWKNFTRSNFQFEVFSGGHFFIYDYPQEIVNIIIDCYNRL